MRAALLILASSTLAAGALLIAATQSPADHIEGTSCGTSSECSGHQYWPRMTLDDLQKCNDLAGCRFVGQDDADELLGYHGSDDVRGGGGSDVLWGDWKGGADQPTSQRDYIGGGGGTDFIYGSHGRNAIYAGPGNDVISVHYGRGFVDCGRGRDIYHVARTRKAGYTFRRCEKVDYRSEAQRGGPLKPLR